MLCLLLMPAFFLIASVLCTWFSMYTVYTCTTKFSSCTECDLLTGLQIQLNNKKPLPPACFDFTWAKFNQTPRSIDWRPLALQEVTFPHIRLHHLHDRDGLADFLSMMDSIPATLAVVLINTENDYRSGK